MVVYKRNNSVLQTKRKGTPKSKNWWMVSNCLFISIYLLVCLLAFRNPCSFSSIPVTSTKKMNKTFITKTAQRVTVHTVQAEDLCSNSQHPCKKKLGMAEQAEILVFGRQRKADSRRLLGCQLTQNRSSL